MQSTKDDRYVQGFFEQLNFWVLLFFYWILFLLTSHFSIQFFRIYGENVSFFWPGAGITLAFLFIIPKKRWGAIIAAQFVGSIVVNLYNLTPIGPTVSFALIDALAVYLVVFLFESQLPDFYELKFLTAIRNFFIITLIVAIFISLLIGRMLLFYYGLDFFIGAARGLMASLISWWLITPFLVSFFKTPADDNEEIPIWRQGTFIDQWAETIFYFVLILGTAWYLFIYATPVPGQFNYLRSYILFPLFFPIVARFRIPAMGLLITAVSMMSLVGTTLGLGEFALSEYSLSDNLRTAQYFIMALAFSTYILRVSVRRIRFTRTRLERSEKEQLSTFDNATVGILRTDMDGKVLRMNNAVYQMLGYSPESQTSTEQDGTAELAFFDEADAIAFRNTFTRPNGWGGELIGLKSVTGDKVYGYLTAHQIEDEMGRPNMQIFVNDVTEQVKLNESLIKNEQRMRMSTDATLTGIWEYDVPGHKLSVNNAMLSLLSLGQDEFPGSFHELLKLAHPEDMDDFSAAGEGLAMGVTDFIDVEVRLQMKPQGWRWLQVKGSFFERSPEGVPLLMLGTAVDITNIKMTKQALRKANSKLKKQLEDIQSMQQRLEQQSIRDPLTNLYNRRFLDDALLREMYRAEREKNSFGLILLDVDHYHEVAETLGNEKGKQILVLFADILQKNFRGFDYACRLDAENFAVLIPDGDVQACKQRVNEIANQFKSRVHTITGLSMSLSCGISSFPASGPTIQDLTAAAEKALNQAKQNGRDQIVMA